jgi:hypothetical protein
LESEHGFSPREQASQKNIVEILFCFSFGGSHIVNGDLMNQFNDSWRFYFAMNLRLTYLGA